jgi:hypothetical protein
MEKKITKEFSTTKEALDFITELSNLNPKINGLLNCSLNKDKTYSWLVTYIPKESIIKNKQK